ncbi:MAG: glucosamine-6-phosphate deaminase, partial [Clostridia bacterium]|nr:glucosamine-6-phosphate deaminase [Clostridia bacterium]
ETCKQQQVREGWFPSIEEVPQKAITMSPRQIMAARIILSVVPHRVKALAVYNMLTSPLSSQIPATLLTEHPACTLFLYEASGSMIKQ